MADETAVQAMVQAVLTRFGRLDVLVNCAAIWQSKPLEDVTAGDWCLEHRDRWRRLYVEGKPALGEPA